MNSSSSADAVCMNSRTRQPRTGLTQGSARSVLMTILGEVVWPAASPARTSALLYIMIGLGFEEATARQAIIRASDAGWIEGHKSGREVSWTLTPYLVRVFEDGLRLVSDLSNPFLEWDSRWLVLFVTVPQSRRSQRKRLYRDLTRVGFGNPYPGVWLSPHAERGENAEEIIKQLDLSSSTLSFHGTADTVGISENEIVARGWDLDSLAEDYSEVLEEFRNPLPISEDDFLFTEIRAMTRIQGFTFIDPQLPEALVPEWIGRRVTDHIKALRSEWKETVRQRWAAINGETSPG